MPTQPDGTFLDVVVIGAGLGGKHPSLINTTICEPETQPRTHAGICAAVKLREQYPQATLGVFEKNARIGGTWAKNTYPGLRCDIPSEVRLFPFLLQFTEEKLDS
jgi:cation diffusion facilitator CzcD-associated flavoprotein CzcO